MDQVPLILNSEPIGQGRERSCYVHPDDPNKLIKVSNDGTNVQTRREIDFYIRLSKRKEIAYTHLPNLYGQVNTSLGEGIVVDLIRDSDGSVLRSMRWYLNHHTPIQTFEPYLDELKNYLLDNLIIFNHDLVLGNLLFQRLSAELSILVIIDGIGDVDTIQWLNRFPGHARAMINRRWKRFIRHVYRYPEVIQYLDTDDDSSLPPRKASTTEAAHSLAVTLAPLSKVCHQASP